MIRSDVAARHSSVDEVGSYVGLRLPDIGLSAKHHSKLCANNKHNTHHDVTRFGFQFEIQIRGLFKEFQ